MLSAKDALKVAEKLADAGKRGWLYDAIDEIVFAFAARMGLAGDKRVMQAAALRFLIVGAAAAAAYLDGLSRGDHPLAGEKEVFAMLSPTGRQRVAEVLASLEDVADLFARGAEHG